MQNNKGMIYFKTNNRKQQLDRYEKIVRENGWLPKGEPFETDERKFYVIMEKSSRLVGYYALEHHKDKQVEIKWLYVLPEYQETGIAERTLILSLKTLYKMNMNTAYCRVETDNDRAYSLCAQYGYIMGEDERLYDPLEILRVKFLVDNGEYVFVFFQKSWGETKAIMRRGLEDVFNCE